MPRPLRRMLVLCCLLTSISPVLLARAVEPKVLVEPMPCPSAGTIRVFVGSTGSVEVDGAHSTLEQLRAKVAHRGSTLVKFCYSNEGNPTSESAHRAAMQALEALAETGLPIDFYEDKHFRNRMQVVY